MTTNSKLFTGLLLGILVGGVTMSLISPVLNADKASAPLSWAASDQIVKDYQNNPYTASQTEPRLYVTNGSGTKELLKSWWISKSDMDRLISDTQAKLNSMQGSPAMSGFRFYPALQAKSETGSTVPAHHSLVSVGTYLSGSKHNNVKVDSPQEFYQPCPDNCDQSTDAALGN